jgi:hypothetical protein
VLREIGSADEIDYQWEGEPELYEAIVRGRHRIILTEGVRREY